MTDMLTVFFKTIKAIFKLFNRLISLGILIVVIVIVIIYKDWIIAKYNYLCQNYDTNLSMMSKINLLKDIAFSENNSSDDNDLSDNSNLQVDSNNTEDILYKVKPYTKAQVKILTDTPVIYSVEIVNTPQTRAQGLMYRDNIDDYTGMFFVMPNDVMLPFWMKNVKFPLDIIFIDKNLTIIDIAHDTKPCTQSKCELFSPQVPYRYVLEVMGGSSKLNNIQVGDKIEVVISYNQ